MNTNTVLAVVIVVLFIFLFITWIFASVDILMNAPGAALNIIVPGLIMFGFWGFVAWRLYNCHSETLSEQVMSAARTAVSPVVDIIGKVLPV